ncbi:MAG: pyridoxamine 5'-phosphate oxidase family protein [Pyrinomonadaceae bacterium]
MIEIQDLQKSAIQQFLERSDYGHLACCADDEPYVVPIHFAYCDPFIYIYTTEGKKTEIIARNPRVCLQVEEVSSNRQWTSVIVYGEAERLVDERLKTEALNAVLSRNPTLTPAVSIRWIDSWIRENIEAVYRIIPVEMTGRATLDRSAADEDDGDVVPARSRTDVL